MRPNDYLGMIYAEGQGATQDLVEAESYFQQTADIYYAKAHYIIDSFFLLDLINGLDNRSKFW